METTAKEVEQELPGFVRVFKDGSVERLQGAPLVPPTPEDPETGVSSKDVTIPCDISLSARLYLPKLSNDQNLSIPILVYFHGGGFCVESAFSSLFHRYMNILASQANVLIVSVEYRLAPEHPLPAAYEDCWTALNWAASLSDPWLANHGDLEVFFIGGDSSGGNIVHNIAMKAGAESLNSGVKILGAFYSHPYFLDKETPLWELAYMVWDFVYPDAPGGPDSHMINPIAVGAPSLSGLGCSRVLMIVAENDRLRDSAVRYYDAVKKSGFKGLMEFHEAKGEDHCFHVFNPDTENAKLLLQHLVSFLHK